MISAGRDAPCGQSGFTLRSLSSLTDALCHFPLGTTQQAAATKRKMPGIQRGSPSETEEQSLFSPAKKTAAKETRRTLKGKAQRTLSPKKPSASARGTETRSRSRAPKTSRCSKTTLRSRNSPGMARATPGGNLGVIKVSCPFLCLLELMACIYSLFADL